MTSRVCRPCLAFRPAFPPCIRHRHCASQGPGKGVRSSCPGHFDFRGVPACPVVSRWSFPLWPVLAQRRASQPASAVSIALATRARCRAIACAGASLAVVPAGCGIAEPGLRCQDFISNYYYEGEEKRRREGAVRLGDGGGGENRTRVRKHSTVGTTCLVASFGSRPPVAGGQATVGPVTLL